jgi:phosphinothricin acetyltransferase
MKIRPAMLNDLDEITKIYNEAILETVATFDTQPKTMDEQEEWFEGHGSKNPILVAEQDGTIVGWASLGNYSTRCAYSDTAEISLYVKKEYQGKGFGTKLMDRLIEEGEKAGLHAVIARITEGNKQSVHLHESVGFEHVGIMKEVGLKFGKRLDVYLMQKTYKDTD